VLLSCEVFAIVKFLVGFLTGSIMTASDYTFVVGSK